MTAARKIIIDTDPGQDDAVAILLALASPELEVLGLTVVAGNVPLALTQKNARVICELVGRRDVKILAGCDAPLKRKLVTAEHVHGKTGLDGITLPEPAMPLAAGHAVDFLIETLRRETPGDPRSNDRTSRAFSSPLPSGAPKSPPLARAGRGA